MTDSNHTNRLPTHKSGTPSLSPRERAGVRADRRRHVPHPPRRSFLQVALLAPASLTLLGLGDPVLPTWGKVIEDARAQGALHNGQYYWVLQPAALLMVVGLSFAMVGFSLDRVFNPRLRGL